MATKHIMQDIQGNICCTWACVILLEKCCNTCPATRMTPFCTCWRYNWFVTVASIKISPVSPWSLTAHHAVYFAGWSDISVTLCGFSEAQDLVFCFLKNPLRWKWASCSLRWCSLLSCKILIFLHLVAPPFTVPTSYPYWCLFQTVACFSEYPVFHINKILVWTCSVARDWRIKGKV